VSDLVLDSETEGEPVAPEIVGPRPRRAKLSRSMLLVIIALVAIRIVDVTLEELHILLRLAVLLLDQPLPLVLIPDLRRLEIVVSHRKNPYCTVVSDAT
jgi:hypothetical protein